MPDIKQTIKVCVVCVCLYACVCGVLGLNVQYVHFGVWKHFEESWHTVKYIFLLFFYLTLSPVQLARQSQPYGEKCTEARTCKDTLLSVLTHPSATVARTVQLCEQEQ